MIDPPRRRRGATMPRAAVPVAVFLCAVLSAIRPAVGQRIANQFDDATTANGQGAQGAATGGPAAPPGARTLSLVPHVPKPVSRPDGWPGAKRGTPADEPVDNHVLSSIRAVPGAAIVPLTKADDAVVAANFEEPAAPSAPASPRSADAAAAQSLETAMVVARVGPEVVLEADLLTPTALAWLAKVSPGLKPEQVRELRLQICRQVINQHVESMLVYVDACRTIPEDRLPEIEKKVNEAFDQQQLQRLIKDAGVGNAQEYEHLLRSRGQSLDRIRKTFFERALAQQWIQQKVTIDAEIPHAEMIAWYENHLSDYDFQARAKFEHLAVRVAPQRSREQAWNLLAAMGNDVLEGKPFAEIARSRSEGPTAPRGGGYDWTHRGSLASKVLDEAVFTLPVGQLSAILDDGAMLHIVRVTERVEAGRTPFIEAQVGIRETLQQERRQKEMTEYLAKLKERTPVWTIFDDQPAGSFQTAGRPGSAAR